MIVGTAGHIDHGKTLLVKALTGVETDRLKEEQARGITIELGFAYLPLPGGGVLGFVDVPGHERFVHTMLAGAASIEFVVLVVAADDGVMPQTREHLQIIDLLGISDGVVALNKVDLVDASRREEVEAEIRAALAGTALDGADILPVSALTGLGIDELRTRLVEEAESRPGRASRGAFRMAVDRSFTVAGAGTVATGVVLAGSVAVGDRVVILPNGSEARVRAIHANSRTSERAMTGERAAVNLAGIERTAVGRGDWLVDPGHASVTARFDAELRLLATEPRPFATWSPAHLHLGTSEALARIVILDHDRLAPGQSGLVQVVLEKPLPARAGDRFVIRDAGAERTIAGGRVVDPRAPQRKRRTPERKAQLEALLEREPEVAFARLLELPPGIVDVTAFAVDRGLADDEAELVVSVSEPVLADAGGKRFAASAETVDAAERAVVAVLAAFHADTPALPGMTAEALRLRLSPRPARPTMAAILAMLAARGRIVAQAGHLRLAEHTSSLAGADARLWERMEKLITDERFRPPLAREMAEALGQPLGAVRKLAKTMARMGTLVEVATDRFFLRTALVELGEMARELAAQSPGGTFTAAEFRDKAGSGRNVGIQILEHFDRRGLTARRGDVRSVVKEPAEVFGRPAG
jgi:selenocysteine-specific elongation factor